MVSCCHQICPVLCYTWSLRPRFEADLGGNVGLQKLMAGYLAWSHVGRPLLL